MSAGVRRASTKAACVVSSSACGLEAGLGRAAIAWTVASMCIQSASSSNGAWADFCAMPARVAPALSVARKTLPSASAAIRPLLPNANAVLTRCSVGICIDGKTGRAPADDEGADRAGIGGARTWTRRNVLLCAYGSAK